jgi:anti-sigma B factor antagonist
MVIAEPVDTQLVILEPNGRLTAETVDEFNLTVSKWVRRGWHDLILDLGFVTYLDSAGIGALAQLHLSSQRRGGRAVFVNVAGKTRELLRVTKLLTVFEVYESTTAAKRSFAGPRVVARAASGQPLNA